REPLEVVTSGRGTGSGYDLQVTYHRLLDLAHKVWQYHFEFLNLGYAAYLDFFGFCKQAFPSIADLAIAKMVAGIEVDLFRPDEEIRAERDRIVAGYLELLGSDEDRAAFEAKLGLARMVFPYVENHNFYVEHWAQSVIWRKMRDLGRIFQKEGVVTEVDDVF